MATARLLILARMRLRLHDAWLPMVLVSALPGRAAAHASDATPDLSSAWTLDAALLLPLVTGILMYAIGLVQYWRRGGTGHGIRVAEAVAFIAGVLVLSIALVWPLDVLGDWSLAMHMAQHMLLIAVAAPLLLLGRPGVVWLKVLPAAWASRVTRPFKILTKRKAFAVFAGITAATLLQTGVMWAWHAPQAMQSALTNDLAHYAMHGSFLAAGLFFWWALLHSLRNNAAGFGAGAIALVGTMAQMGLLSALLTFSPLPRYPWYFERSGALGLTPLEDQQLAGLIMWVPGAVPYLIGALWLTAAWLRRSERGDARRRRFTSARSPVTRLRHRRVCDTEH